MSEGWQVSRQPEREQEPENQVDWFALRDRLMALVVDFKETRLYVQVVVTATLVAVAGLSALVPVGPVAHLRDGMASVVTKDYDFAGRAAEANAWAKSRGGWIAAVSGVWSLWTDHVEQSVAELGLAGNRPAPSPPVIGDASFARPTGASSAPRVSANPDGARSETKPMLPVDGAVLYGYGWLPHGSGDHLHEGLDLVAPKGSVVVSAADGTVVAITSDPRWGRLVQIQHGELLAYYTQLDEVKVRLGQKVRRGEAIATLGDPTGDEKHLPAHLHLEVRTVKEKVPVDPASFLGLGGNKL